MEKNKKEWDPDKQEDSTECYVFLSILKKMILLL